MQNDDMNEPAESSDAIAPDSPVSSPLGSRFMHRSGLWIGLGIGLVAGVLVGGLRLTSEPATAVEESDATEMPQNAQPVTVAMVQSDPINQTLTATGTVVPFDLLPIAPRTSGLQIQQVLVDEGDVVEAGQVLAVLDDAVLRSQLLEAQASLASAQAAVEQQRANLAQAEATRAEANANLQRFQALRDEGVISALDYDSRATAAITSQQSVQVAIANVSSARAQVESQQARIQQLQTQLEQTLVTAPASGIVAERMGKIGDVSSTGNPMFSLIQDGRLELEVTIPETQLPQVQVGTMVQITSDVDSRIQGQGRVSEISPLIDPQTREAIATVALPPSDLLRSGMFLQANIVLSSSLGLTVPAEAVLPQADGSRLVYTVGEDGTAIAQTVDIGEVLPGEPSKIEVISGLQAGDRVVVSGATYLNEGDRVNIVSDNPTRSANPMSLGADSSDPSAQK
jgi:RND family efflux transporter MFP subunit